MEAAMQGTLPGRAAVCPSSCQCRAQEGTSPSLTCLVTCTDTYLKCSRPPRFPFPHSHGSNTSNQSIHPPSSSTTPSYLALSAAASIACTLPASSLQPSLSWLGQFRNLNPRPITSLAPSLPVPILRVSRTAAVHRTTHSSSDNGQPDCILPTTETTFYEVAHR